MLSIVLTTDTFLSMERFAINFRRRSSGDGCGGGTITAGGALREKFPGFNKFKRGFFSCILEPLALEAIEIVSLAC